MDACGIVNDSIDAEDTPAMASLGDHSKFDANTSARTDKTGDADEMEKVMKLARRKVVSKPVQMIKEDGTFCEFKAEKFINSATNLLSPGESYAIISIIGPQSSGKSFLLNHLFGTDFSVMKAIKGRRQTTKGILLGRSTRPCALIMDVEGSDGREREEDIQFERKAALFALTVSDLMMINLWLRDIGRQQGGCVPLLKIVFQERVKLDPGKTKVLVVIRGYDYETPFETLEDDILTTMEEIWMSVHDGPDGTDVQFTDYIEVMVVALPDKILERKFEQELTKLREWFVKENIVGLRQDKNATSGFSCSAMNIWEAIKQNKQLDLAGNKLAVSIYVCQKVAKECFEAVIRDKDFEGLDGAASPDEFIVKLEALLQNCVTRYNKDTEMSDETQRDAKRDVLKEKILQSAEPFAKNLLHKIRSGFLSEKKEEVTALLIKSDDPAMEAPTIVEGFLELFTRSCGGFRSKYKLLFLESRDMLRTELELIAKATTLHIKEQRMKEEVERRTAEAERMTNEAKHEREKAEAMLAMKLQELEFAQKEAALAEKNADTARKEAILEAKKIKEAAKAAAAHSRAERSSYKGRMINFIKSAFSVSGIPDVLEAIPGAVEYLPDAVKDFFGLTE